jgi:hypothetical protein
VAEQCSRVRPHADADQCLAQYRQHGNLFEFVRNSKFDALNYFYLPPAGSSVKNEPVQRNEYGFTLGGPIRRNLTYLFVDVEETWLFQTG